jgi:hypothetical protein
LKENTKEQNARLFLEKLSELDELINGFKKEQTELEKSQQERNTEDKSFDQRELRWLEKCFW